MEKSSNLHNYPWFDSIEGDVLYVKYMNEEVFSIVPDTYTLRFSVSKDFQTEKYYKFLDLDSDIQ